MEGARSVPALLHRRLTPVYDLFARAFLRDARLKSELVARARIGPGHLGAGTGTLAILVKLGSFEPIRGNLEGLLPRILGEAGFDNVEEAGPIVTLFGTLWIVSGQKPG
jgi:hypothetical protein